MVSPYWKDSEKAIFAKFQSHIENDIWEYKDTPSSQGVLTDCWVFKIKKDGWD